MTVYNPLTKNISDDFLTFWVQAWKQSHSTILWPIQGSSMEPFLKIGDTIEIIACPLEKLRIGDVIVFIYQNRIIAHRLLYYDYCHGQWRGREQGDACQQGIWLQSSDFIGKVCSIQRSGYKINLQNFTWKMYNRILGYYGLIKIILRKIRSKIFV